MVITEPCTLSPSKEKIGKNKSYRSLKEIPPFLSPLIQLNRKYEYKLEKI